MQISTDTLEQYQQSLARVTGPDKQSEFPDERISSPAMLEADREACKEWLCAVDFPEDAMTWHRIQRQWVAFLSSTCREPDCILAPDAKRDEGRFRRDRRLRLKMRFAVTGTLTVASLPGMEAMTERWPARVRTLLNEQDDLRRGTALETLAPAWEIGRRQRCMAMWHTMVSFLLFCIEEDEAALEGLGLKLDDDLLDELLDIRIMARSEKLSTEANALWGTWGEIRTMVTSAMGRPCSTAKNNPLLWWMGIHVRSAVSALGPDDYITRGRFQDSPLPMGLDLRGRAAALTHYAKIMALGDAEMAMARRARGVRAELNGVDIGWIDAEGGRRPDPGEDKRDCTGPAWSAVLETVGRTVGDVFSASGGMAMAQISRLEVALAAGGRARDGGDGDGLVVESVGN